MPDILSIIGTAALVCGVALWSFPAALIVLGVVLLAAAVLLERGGTGSRTSA